MRLPENGLQGAGRQITNAVNGNDDEAETFRASQVVVAASYVDDLESCALEGADQRPLADARQSGQTVTSSSVSSISTSGSGRVSPAFSAASK